MVEIRRWLEAVESDAALREYYAGAVFFGDVIESKQD